MEKARSVYELKLELDWDTTQGDFKRLRNALSKTSVGVLELQLWNTDGPTSDLLNRSQRYDPILGIMAHPSIQSFAIRGPRNFSRRSSVLSRDDEFPNLRHLDVALDEWEDDIPGVNCLITKSPKLASVALGRNGDISRDLQQKFDGLILPPTLRRLDIPLHQWEGYTTNAAYIISKAWDVPSLTVGVGLKGKDNRFFLEAYNTIAEQRTYPLVLKDWDFCIPPPPPKESNQAMIPEKYVRLLLDFYWKWNNPRLNVDTLDELTMDAITKATTNGSRFTSLELTREGQLGDSFVNNISSVVGRSELNDITFFTRQDPGGVRIFESIQWKHLRTLEIYVKAGTFETSVMRTLVDGVTKMSEKVELDVFEFNGDAWFTLLTLPEGDLLQTFVASISIKDLRLYVDMTLEQILSLCRSTDVSRLERLKLYTGRFDSVKVDAVIDGVGHATRLRELELEYAKITDEQKSRMKSRGITLKDGSWEIYN